MKKFYRSFFAFLLFCNIGYIFSQCGTNTQLGATNTCGRSGVSYVTEILPNSGCGVYTVVNNYSPGTYFRIPVLNGACYTISTCGASTDTHIECFQGASTTGPFAWDDDSGPECGGLQASVLMTPAFTDYANIDIRQYNCQSGGTSSITVYVRQNNNLAFTSSNADMCQGQTRALTATPAPVGSAQPNSGSLGTFTGTGVSGTTFTAPTPGSNSQTYTLTYTYGYCSTTQNITVYHSPTASNAGTNFSTACGVTTANLSANTPTFGSGTWTVVSGPGLVTTPGSPTSGVTNLTPGTSTVFRWTISNGPCAASSSTVTVTSPAVPTATATPSTQTVPSCTATNIALSSTPGGATFNWTASVTSGSATGFSNSSGTSIIQTLTNTGAGNAIVRYVVTPTLGSCNGSPTNVDITVNPDNINPTLVCPGNQTLNTAAGICTATYTIADPISDNCPGATWSYSLTGATTNSASGIADGTGSGALTFNRGVTTVAINGIDARGNNATTCSFTVTVNDNQAPTLACPSNQTLNTAAGICTANYTIADPISDNCTGSTWGYTLSGATTGTVTGIADGTGSGALAFNKGVTTVVLSGTDGTNTATTCSFTVTVNDNQAPTLACPSNQTLNTAAGVCTANYTIADPISDNCTGSTWSYTLSGATTGSASGIADGTGSGALTFNKGVTTVTVNGTDGTNAAAPCSFTVTVNDNQAPTLVCPSNQTLNTAPGICALTFSIPNPISDNCPGATWGYTLSGASAGSASGIGGSGLVILNKGVTTVTITGTDGTNSATPCSFTVTVNDNQAPTLACPSNQTLNTAAGICTANYTIADPISDNCTGSTWGYTLSGATTGTVTGIADGTGSGALTFNRGVTTVVLSGTDGTNTATTCSFTVTVNDNQAPALVCPSNQTLNTGAGVCTANYTITDPISDNCTGSTWGYTLSGATTGTVTGIADGSNSSAISFNRGVTTVVLSGTDGTNTATTCSFTVTVNDNQAPALVCPSNQTLNTGAGVCTANYTITDPISDNCTGSTWGYTLSGATTGTVTGIADGSNSSAISFNGGVTTVVLSGTDGTNTATTCSFTVTVNDNQAPALVCPSNQTLNTGAGVCTADYTITDPISDNCTGSTWGYTLSGATTGSTTGIADGTGSGSLTFNTGVTNVVISGVDASSNLATTCSFTVTVQDNTNPTAVCQDIVAQLNLSGVATITAAQIDNGSNDACGIASMSVSPNSFTCADIGANTVTLTVTDNNGNTSTCNATVTVADNGDPDPVCQNITVQLDGTGNASITASQIDNGSSDACGIASMSVSPNTFTTANVGANTVTLTVTDNNGNTSTCNATVTVADTIDPMAVCQDIAIQLDSSGMATINAAQVDNGSNDASGIASMSVSPNSFTCANVGSNTVTLTVTDNNGNTSTCNATVTITDTIDPVVISQNITVPLDATGNASITASQVDNGSNDACGISSMSVSPNTFTTANIGPNTVILTITDGHGNTSTGTAIVFVVDTIDPVAICQDITVQLDVTGNVGITASQIDNGSNDASGIASMSVSPNSFTCANIGANTVTLTVTDSSGNTSTCTATVTVADTIDPVAVCQDITAQLDATGNASITAAQIDNGSNDACGIASLNVSPNNFTCANIGANTVTLTVTDNNGNVSTCNATVTVADTIDPVAVCQDITVQLDATGNTSITAAQIDNGSNDACGIALLNVSPNNFTCANIGANTVTLTVTDNNGNVSTCNATVTVADTIDPVAVCQDITVQLDATGNVAITAAQIDNGSNDACGIASMNVSPNSFTCANIGSNTVTLTVTDNNGNVSTCNATVTVADTIDPIASCQNITAQLDATGNVTITAAQIDNGSTDACGIASMSVSPNSFTCANIGANTVTLTVTDNNGNISTCNSTVTVADTIDPVAVCQNITVQLDGTGNASITAAQIDNGSSDACGIASISVSPNSFTCANIGSNAVTLTVTDNNGNVSTCNATVTVADTIDPVAVCQDITVQLDATGNVAITAAQIDNGSNDVCGIASMNVSPGTFNCSNIGSNTVTLTVTDNNGNVSTCNATVTVADTIDPVAVCQNITVQLDATGNATITAAQVDNGSNDACGIASMNVSPDNFTCANIGSNTVTLTVTDNNGNVSTCNATVTVADTIDPVASCQNITVQLDGAGNASITAAQIDNGSTDACGIASMNVSPNSFTCANIGANTVTLTVTDNNGNVSTCNATVTVADTIDPVASCQNITVQLDGTGNAIITAAQIDNGSNDACGIASMSVSPTNFTCANIGSNTVTLTVTDNNGNISICNATVTVADTIDPVAVCQDITVQLDATGNATITAAQIDNGSNDACGIASMNVSPNNFTCANIGSNTVTLTVTDNNGNVSTCNATVTVADTIDPVASCQNITVQLDGTGNASITAAQIDNGSTDGCGIASMSVSPNSFTCANTGSNTVTLTVTDNNGNISTCNATVTVADTIDPVASCQNITVQLDGTGNATITAAQIDNGSNDACGIASVSVSPNTFNCSNIGINTVTLTVTDNNGNISTCNATVTVADTVDPVAVCQDITVQLDATGNATITAAQVDNGSNDDCGIASMNVSPNTFNCSNIGANTVTLTVSDNSGNISTCTATVTVADTIDPVASCQNITVQLDATGNVSITAAQIDNGSNDACGIASINVSPNSFNCGNIGSNTVTLTVTDNNGNTSTCNATVTVADTIDPVAVCQDISLQLDGTGTATITASQIDNGSNDACGIASMSVSPNTFTCVNAGPNTVTLTVTDNNGNISTCTATVTISDTLDPAFVSCPSDIIDSAIALNCGKIINYTMPSYTDNCVATITQIDGTGLTSGQLFPVGVTVQTYVVSDGVNSDTCSFTITIVDNQPPIITNCPGNITTTNTANLCGANVNWVAPTASDNCPGVVMTSTHSPGSVFPVGTTTVSYIATDVSGNSDTCSFTVTVTDTEAPVIVCPGNITVPNSAGTCGAVVSYSVPVGTDNCPGATTAQTDGTGLTSGSIFPVGTTTQTFTVTDANGLTSTCSFTITVTDTEAPVLACGSDITDTTDAGVCGAVITYTAPVGTDNCPGVTTVQTAGLPSGSVFPVGVTTNTFTSTDASGNTTTCSFTVTITDNEDPSITCPGTQNLNLDGACTAILPNYTSLATTNDNCGIASITQTPAAGTTVNGTGVEVITLTVTDIHGNTNICTFNVTKTDITAPVIACAPNQTQSNDVGMCSATVTVASPVANDNCGPVTLTNSFNGTNDASGVYPVGTTTVVWTATDGSGLTATCTQTITVNDTELPVIACPGNITQSNDSSVCGATVTYTAPVGTDNCPGVTTIQTAGLPSGSVFPVGVTTNTFTSTDASGNTTTCSFTVTITDNEDPSITCPGTQNLNLDGACTAILPGYTSLATTNDNCGIASVTQSPAAGTTVNGTGVEVITLTVTDIHGNTNSCTFNVTKTDITAPVIACAPNQTQSNDVGMCSATVTVASPVANDNCGPVTLTNSFNGTNDASGVYPVGTTTVVWTATDGSGLTATCTQTITVNDTELPVIACPSNITQSNDSSVCGATVTYTAPVGTDNCPGVTTVQTAGLPSGSVFPVGVTTNTFTSTDASGNTTTCSFTVTITDNEDPSITCPGTQNLNLDGACTAILPGYTSLATTNDNCGVASVTQSPVAGTTVSGTGVEVITLTVTDIHGNTNICTFNVTKTDITAPVIACAPNQTQSNDVGMCSATVTVAPPVANDNCGPVTLTNSFNGTNDASGVYPVGTTTIVWTATDGSGLTATCTQTITVNDTEAPVLACVSNITDTTDAGVCGATVTYTTPIGTDNCPGVTTVQTAGLPSGSVFPVGVTTNTFTSTDASGNTTTCSFTVTITDNEDPSITCPGTQNLNLDGACTAILPGYTSLATTNDNCGVASVTQSPVAGTTVSGTGVEVITLTVTDIHGNTNICTFNVTKTDITAPVIACAPDQTQSNDVGMCSATVTVASPVANDNCGPVTLTNSFNGTNDASGVYPIGTTTVVWTATDGSGLTATCTQTITVNDTEAPVLACVSNITDTTDAGVCGATVTYTAPVGTDNCPGVTTVQTAGLPSGSVFPVGVTTNTFTSTDASGNTTTCSFTVTITDNEDPSITCPGTQNLNLDGACTAILPNYTSLATTNDNCGIASITQSPAAGTTVNGTGVEVITLTVTDIHGNTNICTFNVTKTDITAPVIACAPNQTQSNDVGMCSATVTVASPVANDNCGPVTLTNSFNGTNDASGVYPVGTTTVVWTATDGSGLTATCTQTITVNDTELPVIACPSNITQSNDSSVCGATVTYTAPVGTDNCPGVTTVQTAGLPSGSVFPVGTTTNTFTVTDAHGNTTTCSFTVTINDTEAPVTNCTDINVNTTPGLCGASVNYTVPFTDNCPGATVTQTDGTGYTSGNFFPVGTTVQSYIITDGSGNTATCTFNVIVTDNEAPLVVCPSNITVSNDPGICGANVNMVQPVYSDNCNVASVTNDYNGTSDGSGLYPVGTTTVIWTVTDVNGNNSACSMTVTVNDTEAPSIACAANQTQTADTGVCSANVTVVPPVVNDNCGIASVVNNYNGTSDASDIYPVGTTSVVWTVTDIHGNTNTCTQLITVTDDELPSVICAADQTQSNDPGVCNADVTVTAPAVNDNCGIATIVNDYNGTSDASDNYPVGTTQVTWTVTDIHGNVNTCVQQITVTDDEAPVPTVPVLPVVIGQCNASVNTPTATDNCNGLINGTTTDPVVYTTQGTFTITWTYMDVDSNISTQTQTVIIQDTIDPVPTASSLPTVTGECTVNLTAPTAFDNCTGLVNATTIDPLTYTAQGTYTVTWTYDDGHGNTATQTQTVVVDDVTAPVADAATLPVVTGQCNATIATAPTATDNCVGTVTGTTTDPLTYSAQGTYTVTWTYDDGNGNTTTQTQTVVVDDTTAPVADVTTLPNVTGQCNVTISTMPTATDNCSGTITGTTTDPLTYSAQGTYTVTWTYDDGNGNTTTQTQTVVVDDTTAPVADVTTLPNVTGQCNVTISTMPTATDNCSGTITGTTTDPLTYSAQGTYTVTWTYDDGNGNTTTQTQTVVIDDTTAPVADVATLPTVTGECSVTVSAPPTATDNCNGSVTGTTNNPLTYTAQGTYTITWTYNDGNGNTVTQTQTVVVDDITAPVPDVTNLPTVTGDCSVTLTHPTATDNCTGTITATTFDPTTYNVQGTFTVTWIYFDGNGNQSTQTQTVVVDDNAAPVPDVASLPVITGSCSATVSGTPTATDVCSGTVNGTTTDPLTYTAQGTYTITWTYTDQSGNTSTQTQTVVVDDNVAPVPTVSNLPDVTGECSVTVTATPTANDGCGGLITGTTSDPLTYTTTGTYTITWLYNDGNGNTFTQTQTVIVTDNTAPVPSQSFLPNVTGNCAVTVFTVPTANDDCGGVISGTTSDALSYGTPGTYTITWEYQDGNGNITTQNQTVIVNPCLGIDPSGEGVSMNLYPNPSNGIFTIELSHLPAGIEMRVIDELGQMVYTQPVTSQLQSYDLSHLRAATYYVQILSSEGNVTKVIIITQKY